MSWLQALLLGLVQGLTEFLPVSSSGHLMIVRELLGVDSEGFLDFTVTVHLATVLSTIIVFWKPICKLLAGLFKFKYNDETDYIFKLIVSMVPVALVGFLFKDKVEALFGDSLTTVAVCLIITAVLLFLSDIFGNGSVRKRISKVPATAVGDSVDPAEGARNGINFWQAFVVGIGQALAVAPGLSRSGTTIATGLLCGVKRSAFRLQGDGSTRPQGQTRMVRPLLRHCGSPHIHHCIRCLKGTWFTSFPMSTSVWM